MLTGAYGPHRQNQRTKTMIEENKKYYYTQKDVENEAIRILEGAINYIKGIGPAVQTNIFDASNMVADALKHCGIR